MDECTLKKISLNLEDVLKCNGVSEIDGLDLFCELKVIREILVRENSTPIETLDYIKNVYSFPNTCIAYRISIQIAVAFAEKSLQS